ncbi:hypothetical protein [Desulfosarcina widdelii]|uniref:hypothetical protein n=1 Tax=Desulfosarcina widdelii TaxID=947919 RepID=UPI0012D35994|nr:hypothetical protein [Desulfosarcina widdelii]
MAKTASNSAAPRKLNPRAIQEWMSCGCDQAGIQSSSPWFGDSGDFGKSRRTFIARLLHHSDKLIKPGIAAGQGNRIWICFPLFAVMSGMVQIWKPISCGLPGGIVAGFSPAFVDRVLSFPPQFAGVVGAKNFSPMRQSNNTDLGCGHPARPECS